ncbi:bifunctional serine/threonine-protein kinase/ABC transporter substrate-binding protein [Tychonema sp. BBK16]|uniref:bifunctional serine/threonine-protein kinase/ABC transporter substrate-binding protein n=1 Tax=Tychonema sp. BBK16 TaxID=2699888 RepID=UPI001F374148|nr:bifunctional serine/threonine-protein kinase/ABC transporter substrate-binding protein [Tychonema sp. BBK16]MCF6375199.1 bifunctional serine/threonine-protein kinase/ABC transporter substrate-binding protein [Tychonema sp. BBK16]
MCLNPGDILAGRYKIIDRLGQGGFAITYTAQDIQKPTNPLCVIKEIPFPKSDNPQVLERARNRFQREVNALQTLGHDSRIPELFDRFEENENFHLVQEYIEGTPLSQELIQGRQWKEADVIGLLREIIGILIFIHTANVIHRDITPSNLIRRTKNRKIALIDFGAVTEITTFTSNSTGEILTSQAIGTSGYMPPEQYNPRSVPKPYNDIYSVGIIAIQALTGRHPRNLPHDPETGEILWNFSTSDRISDDLTNILNKMVRFDFQQRYQSATEVLEALDLLNLKQPTDLPLTPPPTRSNFRWLLFGFAGLGVALAIAYFIPRLLRPPIPLERVDRVSAGEELIIQTSPLWSKQRAIKEFADGNYPEALKLFKQSWRQDRKDPETLIYLNNSLLMATQAEYYTIAIVVPIRRNQNGSILNANLAEELLRGIAQAQTEVNLNLLTPNNRDREFKNFPGQEFLDPKSMNGKGLRVIIGDDANLKLEAIKRANSLVAQPDILAVIGHYTSDMTVETVDIYNENKVVAISPGSTTEELTRKPRKFFFRTAPTTSTEAEGLANQLLSVGEKKVAVFYNPNSPFSASLWEELKKQFEAKGGATYRIPNYYDLSQNNFNAEAAIKEVEKAGITAIALMPDGQVTSSLENAIAMIKANKDRRWIVAPWTLYDPKTLEAAKQLKSVEKLVISVFWHPLTSFDKKFPENVKKLWVGQVNTRSALTYDATRTLIKAIEMQPQPSREGMQTTLANPNFKATGATGIIEFDSKTGNRKNPPQQLAHIVPCSREQFGVTFVPIEFPTAAAAGLKCE